MANSSKRDIENRKLIRQGVCPLCKKPLSNHAKCPGCGILCGSKHLETRLITFREHELCSFCIERWINMEKSTGHTVSWETSVKGLSIKEWEMSRRND